MDPFNEVEVFRNTYRGILKYVNEVEVFRNTSRGILKYVNEVEVFWNTSRGISKSAGNISLKFFYDLALWVVLCLKYFSENHTMVEFEINTPRSNKILPSVLPKYSSRRREYFGRTRGSILLLRGVFIKIFIEWWSRKTPRRQPRGFSCHHEMNIAPNWTS